VIKSRVHRSPGERSRRASLEKRDGARLYVVKLCSPPAQGRWGRADGGRRYVVKLCSPPARGRWGRKGGGVGDGMFSNFAPHRREAGWGRKGGGVGDGMLSNFAPHRREAGWGRRGMAAKVWYVVKLCSPPARGRLGPHVRRREGSALPRHQRLSGTQRALSRLSASAAQRFRDSAIQRFSDSALPRPPRHQRLSGTQRALSRLSASAAQRFRASAIQRFSDSAIQRFRVLRDSASSAPSAPQRYSARSFAAQRFSGTTLPRFRASSIQRFRASAIQRFRDSAPPRHGQLYTSQAFL